MGLSTTIVSDKMKKLQRLFFQQWGAVCQRQPSILIRLLQCVRYRQARLIHDFHVEKTNQRDEMVLRYSRSGHSKRNPTDRSRFTAQHLRFAVAYRSGQPINEIFQDTGEKMIVLR